MPLLRATQIPSPQRGASRTEPPARMGGARLALAAWGGLLVLIAVWLSAGELLRAKVPRFVSDRDQAVAVIGRSGAGTIGLVRGDVWFDDGLAGWAGLLAKGEGGSRDAAALAAVRAALVRAVRLAPHDARAWLLLAAVETRSGAAPDKIAAALKMSYYTGSNEALLIPLRIGLTSQPGLAGDGELRTLLETEILTIAQHAAIRPSLAQAYRLASPDGQRVLRDVVTAIDAGLAADMQAGAAKP